MVTKNLTFTGELVVVSCWCGIRLAIPVSLYRVARQSQHDVYCPLGHVFVYTGSENEDLKRQVRVLKEREAWLRTSKQAAQDQARAAERSARAYKGHLTRIRNKVANGVCPVAGCRRHFDNVQAHIATQHPDWAVIDPETGESAVL